MFRINRLEELLTQLSQSIESTETKRFTATQELKAENIHVTNGSTLNIHMHNMIFSVDIVQKCLEIVNEMKCLLPVQNCTDVKSALNHFENILMIKALRDCDYLPAKAAEKAGITDRQMRYWISKNLEIMKKDREKRIEERK